MTATEALRTTIDDSRQALAAAGLTRRKIGGTVYWTGGIGQQPIVLLHGTNDQAGTWAPVIETLASQYQVIAPDLAGHGDSDPRSGPIPISLVLAQVHAVVENENLRDIAIVGNSLGGWIAILYALEHPQLVKRLFLEGGGGLALPFGVPLVAHDRETALTILRAVHGPDYVARDWVIEALLARAVDAPLVRLTESSEHLVDGRLPGLNVPTTLIWGEHDGVVPLAYARVLQEKIAGSRLEIVRGAAHIPHLQQPVRFLQCLTATS